MKFNEFVSISGICLIALILRHDAYIEKFSSVLKFIAAGLMITFGAFVFGVVLCKVISTIVHGTMPVNLEKLKHCGWS